MEENRRPLSYATPPPADPEAFWVGCANATVIVFLVPVTLLIVMVWVAFLSS